ncbi:hypothetical protein MTR67_034587 [Solanum verrucosum]|uniref:Reverse transcriptase domain-containing protein n=1 Tax=Solanum verrucosum TaxID=315347 RepID=A0AAF0U8G3_SOLVR|nr:hypothetical protein MTR67_034587 [Solanum verrucosum]
MTGAPTDARFRPPDPVIVMDKQNLHPSIQESSSRSSYNSSQVREEAIHTALAEKELDGTRNNDDNTGDLSQRRHQNRRPDEALQTEFATGDYNPGRGGHLTKVSSAFHGGIIEGDNPTTPTMNIGNLPHDEDMQFLAQTQHPHKEGTQQVQDLGQYSSSHMEDSIKKQGKDTYGTVTGKQTNAQVSHKDQNLLDTSQHVDEHDPNIINKGKLTPDDYGAINSDDEMDPDNQSIDESDEDIEDTMQHTCQVFGSTFQDKCPDVQRMTEQQGLSPRGRKKTRHNPNQPTTSMSDTSSRPMTRSKSKDNSHIDMVKIQLQMNHATSNPNGKIWLFWSNEVTGSILEQHEQHITVTFKYTDIPDKFMMSFIYAKCKEYMRRPLWDRLLFYANMEIPWCTSGDFNVITSIEEKFGGIPYNIHKSFEFVGVIEACGLTDIGYTGLPFTWCNQRDVEARVWKRLDKAMVNDKWANESHIKYFKFLHFWVENGTFMKAVQQCWEKEVSGNPMWRLHQKIKRVSTTLSNWSKQEYGDIFAKVREFEDNIRKSEEELMTNNTEAFRQTLQQRNATYIRQQQIFTGQNARIDERILQYIPTIVTAEQNEMMQAMPTMEELRQVVFAMNPNSVAGPDGIGGGKFYQTCWSIIKEDSLAAVQSFFCGNTMPKFMTHACLVLLPKNEQPIRFRDLRPISLSNFTNKIISKLLSMRLPTILPLLLSDNQSGFVRGRSITESIMLAQEITHGIKKPQIGNNVVIKLDMAKAYDRVSWSFICLVLRRFGFGELLIDLVWRIMSNNWYSIIINGHRHGFFHSTRGLKQGDPLSPALFILGAEVLSRLLNSLHQIPNYKGFFMEPKGPQINHLSFADDVIIFAATDRHSLKLIMDKLGEYEHTSG